MMAIDSSVKPRKNGARGVTPEPGKSNDGIISSTQVHEYFNDSLDHILAELQRLDLLIQSQVRRARQLHKGDEQFQGLYISEQEVDEMLRLPLGSPRFLAREDPADFSATQSAFERMGDQIGERVAESVRCGIVLRLVELTRLFGLTPFDAGCLLACLAPEIDPRYERLYA